MPEDSAVLEKLAEIAASQKHIAEEQERQRRDTAKVAEQVGVVRHETTVGFGDIHSTLATVTEQLSGHERETDRRFKEQGHAIKRAHVAAKTATDTANDAAADGRGNNVRRDAKVVVSGGALAILFERVLAFFTGNTTPPH